MIDFHAVLPALIALHGMEDYFTQATTMK